MVVRKFRTTTQHGAIEGKTQTHEVLHYNLDVIIALGYRVQSPIAVRFRRWATRLLHEYIHSLTYAPTQLVVPSAVSIADAIDAIS